MEDDMKTKELAVKFNGGEFFMKVVDGKMISLTDMWRGMGLPKDKSPTDWLRIAETADFITVCIVNMVPAHVLAKRPAALTDKKGMRLWAESILKEAESLSILKRTQGRSGGTFAHRQIAMEYAGYLSPELRVLVNQVFIERLEETADPELGITRSRKRATTRWLDGGKSEEWIAERIKGIDERNEFTSTLGTHGVSGKGYGVCTNAIYIPVLHGAAADVRKRMNLSEKANIRDALDERSLASIKFAETLARLNIKAADAYGVESCSKEANRAGEAVKVALLMAKEEPQRRAISR
jgi:hypothetical protein